MISTSGARKPARGAPLSGQLATYEKSLIAAAITSQGGSLKATYQSLGLSRRALYEKMQKHGLSQQDFIDDDTD
ncbi:helix-turn-helix domain-containing protein [uncultured Boseongicola sp.]|uniref:helix-turn-helix domain-containing protein n=1 Tax=uncultured Boseongicola sp. TaxID=1648499 RepID=UPI003433283B